MAARAGFIMQAHFAGIVALALITGASSGIGLELAREHARRGGELVLVARHEKDLKRVAADIEKHHGVVVHVLALDLSEPAAPQRLARWLKQQRLEVEMIINNAGFGGRSRFDEQALSDALGMIDLNVRALTEITHRLLPGMLARGHGSVLNVGSTAGMLPGPLQAVYYASKAFVNSFTQALAEELRDTGVTVTLLCPGPVATGFAKRAGLQRTRLFRRAMRPDRVARAGYEAMLAGKAMVVVPRSLGFTLRKVAPLMPQRLVVRTSRKVIE